MFSLIHFLFKDKFNLNLRRIRCSITYHNSHHIKWVAIIALSLQEANLGLMPWIIISRKRDFTGNTLRAMLHLSSELCLNKFSTFKPITKRSDKIVQPTWKPTRKNTPTMWTRISLITSVKCVVLAITEHCWSFVFWLECLGIKLLVKLSNPVNLELNFVNFFRRNVILFEPTQSLQTNSYIYVKNDDYDCNEPLRVFYSQKDKHFDVIYTMDYAQRLASCQGKRFAISFCLQLKGLENQFRYSFGL